MPALKLLTEKDDDLAREESLCPQPLYTPICHIKQFHDPLIERRIFLLTRESYTGLLFS